MDKDYSKRLDNEFINEYFIIKPDLPKFDLSDNIFNLWCGEYNHGKEMDSSSN